MRVIYAKEPEAGLSRQPKKSVRAKKKKVIIYPDSDGKPMADNTKQFGWIVKIKENLELMFADRQDVFVAGDLLWYPVEGNNKIRAAPDAMVAFGRPKGHRGSYRTWEEADIVPQVVFEILSPGNTKREMKKKFEFYEKYGVKEYYVYDPDNIRLEGWIRSGKNLQPVKDMIGWSSPMLNIRFEITRNDLHIFCPDGNEFLSTVELDRLRKSEIQSESKRAELESKRADSESKKAQEEHRKAMDERKRADSESKKAQEARRKAMDELKRADSESKKAQEARRKAMDELKRADSESKKAQEARRKAMDERKRADSESKKAQEAHRKAMDERKRADSESKKAQEAHRKAMDERKRAERLAAKLRELGIDPAQV